MSRLHPIRLLVVTCATLLALMACSHDRPSSTARAGDDFFSAGAEVHFSGNVSGDVLLAGGEVRSDGTVGGDAVVAGGSVAVLGLVGEDLYAAGGELRVSARVDGSARLAGGDVEITREAQIADGLTVTGGDIDIDGRIGSYLIAMGGHIRINGTVDGDVTVNAGQLSIGPDAVIQGTVTYRGPEQPEISPGAQISGGVRHVSRERARGEGMRRLAGGAAIVWFVGWLIVGILALALAPEATRAVTDTVRSKPGQSLLLGLAVLAVVPLLMIVFAVTVLGIPVAVLLLLAYLLLLPLGYLASVTSFSDWLAPRIRQGRPVSKALRIGLFAVTLLVVFLLTSIPVLGGLLSLLLVVLGSGGIALALVRRRTATPAAA